MTDAPGSPGGFEPPHSNGAAHRRPAPRRHAPWEFVILLLFVALLAIGIILGWTLVGSKSPERLDRASAGDIAAACTDAQTQLKALPNPYPIEGADRVTRIRAENAVIRTMIDRVKAIHVPASTPQAAVLAWMNDWTNVVVARERYASDLEGAKDDPKKKVQFVLPASGGVKPITDKMDDFVRESHPYLDACFTQALQVETVEGPRTYQKVTQ